MLRKSCCALLGDLAYVVETDGHRELASALVLLALMLLILQYAKMPNFHYTSPRMQHDRPLAVLRRKGEGEGKRLRMVRFWVRLREGGVLLALATREFEKPSLLTPSTRTSFPSATGPDRLCVRGGRQPSRGRDVWLQAVVYHQVRSRIAGGEWGSAGLSVPSSLAQVIWQFLAFLAHQLIMAKGAAGPSFSRAFFPTSVSGETSTQPIVIRGPPHTRARAGLNVGTLLSHVVHIWQIAGLENIACATDPALLIAYVHVFT